MIEMKLTRWLIIFKPSDCFGLEDDVTQESEEFIKKIKEAFSNWISFAEEEAILNPKKVKLLDLDKQAIYLSFNYTDTLARLYAIGKANIIHIHGDIEIFGEEIIFGHNIEPEIIPEIDENGDSRRTIFTDSENIAKSLLYVFKKPTDEIISNHIDFFDGLKDVSEIFVLGHSINNIDLPYYKKIRSIVEKTTAWKVSYYTENEKERFIETLESIGIERQYICLFKMENL
jgi:hypothetical protein